MNQNVKLILLFLVLSFIAKIVLVPIFLALFMAMLLEPVVRFVTGFKVSRAAASTLVILLAGGACAVIGWLAYAASLELIAALPVYSAKLNALLATLNRATGFPELQPAEFYIPWSRVVLTGIGSVYEGFSILIFVPLLMFYFLIDKDNLLESFNVINGRYFNLPKLNFELPRMLRVFFAANLIAGVFLIFAHGLFTIAAGFENWVSLALLSGFLNLLPVVGAPMAIAALFLLGVGVKMTVALALGLIAATLALHFLANNLMVPLFVGSRLNMNAVALIIGLMFWSWMWGIAGFFLAVPMTALIKILLECHRETYAFANLMAARPKRVMAGRSSLKLFGVKPGGEPSPSSSP